MSGHNEEDHGHGTSYAHGSLGEYKTGFILSVILTAIPFGIVMAGGAGSPALTGFIVLAFAAVQIVVHMVYFLHMNARSEGGWNMLALIFTAILVVIVLSGSMWVMHHLHLNMMPAMPDMQDMRIRP